MRKIYSTGIFFLSTLCFLKTFSQGITNTGTEFWVGYGHHQYMEAAYDNSQEMTIYLCTGDSSAIVTVQIDSSGSILTGPWTRVYSIPPNTFVDISSPMPPGVTLIYSPACINAIGPIPKGTVNNCGFDARLTSPAPPFGLGGEQKFSKKGLHITSTNPITAFAHIYGQVSAGATMLLPVKAWGYSYTTINSKQQNADNAYSWVYVVAASDNTLVEITPSAVTRLGKPANSPFTITLNKGDIYQLMGVAISTDAGEQLTGTTVRSVSNSLGVRNPIAVFAGSSRTGGEDPCWTSSGRDNDIQQVFPQESWGKRYLTSPTVNSGGPFTFMINFYKIAVSDTATVVKINGTVLTGLINSKYYLFESGSSDYIEADQPVMVAQFMSGGAPCSSGDGDPDMVYLSALEQARKRSRFFRSTTEAIDLNFLNLIIPTTGLSSLKIDGVLFSNIPSGNLLSYPHPSLPGYTVVVKRWPAAKAECVASSDSAFFGITYGLGGAESYLCNIGARFDTLASEVLPLKLLTFNAKKEGNKNVLQWITAQETNLKYFEVERSKNGREYTTIGLVRQSSNNYTFADVNPGKAINYYRLKIRDKDGTYSYSDVRVVDNRSQFYVSVYPNPAKDRLRIYVETGSKLQLKIQVVSGDGRSMLTEQLTAEEGASFKIINIAQLAKGSYFLKLTSSTKDQVINKFEKL